MAKQVKHIRRSKKGRKFLAGTYKFKIGDYVEVVTSPQTTLKGKITNRKLHPDTSLESRYRNLYQVDGSWWSEWRIEKFSLPRDFKTKKVYIVKEIYEPADIFLDENDAIEFSKKSGIDLLEEHYDCTLYYKESEFNKIKDKKKIDVFVIPEPVWSYHVFLTMADAEKWYNESGKDIFEEIQKGVLHLDNFDPFEQPAWSGGKIQGESLEKIKSDLGVDTISKKEDIITVRREFFYRFGKSEQDIINRVKAKYPNAEIVDSGEHWAAFRGGASVANSSHWYVKFRLI